MNGSILNFLSSPFVLLLPLVFVIFNHITSVYWKRRSLPPGPTPWPLVGNIFHLHKKLHISFSNFAQIHGPLFSLRLGTQIVIVASSPSAAAEILKNHDRMLSARYVFKLIPRRTSELERIGLIWNPTCSDQWKLLRSLSRTELFSPKAIETQAGLRERKLMEMVQFFNTKQGKVVNVGEIVFATVFNIMSNLIFSKDSIGLEDEGKAGGLKSLVWKMMELAATPNMAQFYPILEGLDPQGLRRKMANCIEEMDKVWDIYIKERRARRANHSAIIDFLDVFLANGFDDEKINWLAAELFSAGTETNSTTIEWAMAEILKNKQVMKKVEEELNREINTSTILESQVCQLPYVNACIKETLRLHPPAPFLLPHRAPETCEIMNYTIPKDAQIFVNAWAIGRDPTSWEDPLSFKPERFIGSSIDVKGHNFELIPFGSGRRICPGLPMAVRQLPLILTYLIHYFHWSLPNGQELADLDMNEKFGVTLQLDQPLLLIPKRKS